MYVCNCIFICFHCCIVFYYMTIPRFICLFTEIWVVSSFWLLTNNAALYICQLQCKLHAGRGFVRFVGFCLFRHSRCLEQCLAHGRCSTYTGGTNEFSYVDPGGACARVALGLFFSECAPGTSKGP